MSLHDAALHEHASTAGAVSCPGASYVYVYVLRSSKLSTQCALSMVAVWIAPLQDTVSNFSRTNERIDGLLERRARSRDQSELIHPTIHS